MLILIFVHTKIVLPRSLFKFAISKLDFSLHFCLAILHVSRSIWDFNADFGFHVKTNVLQVSQLKSEVSFTKLDPTLSSAGIQLDYVIE